MIEKRIAERLGIGKVVPCNTPVVGETLDYERVAFTCWDLGGSDKYRPLWRYYSQKRLDLVFVVDSSDRAQVDKAAAELHALLREEVLKDAVLLVFANKQDQPDAMSIPEMRGRLLLPELLRRAWHIQPSFAPKEHGLHEGLDWLLRAIKCQGH
jgi:ADP-ribosylation factor protein 1